MKVRDIGMILYGALVASCFWAGAHIYSILIVPGILLATPFIVLLVTATLEDEK